MNLKIITANEVLLEHNGKTISDEDSEKIELFNERETLSYLVIFNDNIKLKQTHGFDQILKHPEWVKEVIVTLK